MEDLPKVEMEAVEYLQEVGVLPRSRSCPLCGHSFKLVVRHNTSVWRCYRVSCSFTTVAVRSETALDGSKLPFVKLIKFIYMWSRDMASMASVKSVLGISKSSTVYMASYLRELCTDDMEAREKKKKIGGEGLIVEVDESLFCQRKTKAGKTLPQQWVFGGICRETKECFLVRIPDRSAATLLREIVAQIADGSIIYSYSWKEYEPNDLLEAGYDEIKANHRYDFADPETAARMRNIKRMWGSAKWRNKVRRGTARSQLDSYLTEFVWRQKQRAINKDCFMGILQAMAKLHPPDETEEL